MVALLVLRCATASVFMVHGGYRLAAGIVPPFAGYFASYGIPAPQLWPWVVTLVEIVGGVLLALGIFTRPLCAWFALQILVGIVTIHAKAGWFVVGAGRNGMEYSVLILVCLLVTWLTADAAPRLGRQPGNPAAA